MKNYYSVLLLFLGLSLSMTAQAQNVKGKITDNSTGEVLPGVSVLVQGTNQGTVTNAEGLYSLQLKQGNYKLVFSFIGYETQTQEIKVAGGVVNLDVAMIESVASLSEIVVLGSRSGQIRSSTETPVPVDVIPFKDLQSTGQIEPTQMINLVAPSFNSSRQTVADGTDHIDPATVRGLGPDQVLVLVNGKRRHNQALINVNGTIGRGSVGTDLNTIPASAIERVEVLRDGAASQYGSDAIAGVINVVLKKDKGTSANLHVGQHYAGDGRNINLGLYHGLKIGKGSIGIAADLRFREATNRAGTYTGPVYVNWNGTNDMALRQQRFQQDQTLIAQNNFSLEKNMLIGASNLDNYGGMINGSLPIGAKTNFYFSGTINYRKGQAAGFYRYPFQTSQVITDIYPNGFLPEIHSTILDGAFTAGLSGEVGGWKWDLSNVYGGNNFRFDVKNSNNASQFALGRNAQREFYAGTINFNQNTTDFGVSRDFGKQMGLKSFNIAAGLNFRLDKYKIEAGEEASWRNYDPASGRAGGAQVFPGFQPANEVDQTRNVFGAYLDFESDLTEKLLINLAGRFENYSDFGSNFAGKISARYKFADAFSLRAAVSNGFRAPSIHQRHFSAISTVFVNIPNQGLQPRQQGTFRNDGSIAKAFGIPSLGAENSINLSLGVTSQISSNVTLTVDAYQIDIQNRIVLTGQFQRGTSATGQLVTQILDAAGQNEVQGAVFFTNAVNTRTQGVDIVLSATPKIGENILTLTLAGNMNKTTVEGDPKVSATLPADVFGNVLFNRQERARLELAQPRSKFTFSANYKFSSFGFNLRATRFGEVAAFDPSNVALDQTFSPQIVTDFSVNYRPTKFLLVTIGANNILDTYPDRISAAQYPTPTSTTNLDNTSFGRFQYSRAATQFGFNGGYYYVNLGVNF